MHAAKLEKWHLEKYAEEEISKLFEKNRNVNSK
jgi:hypothetical protein